MLKRLLSRDTKGKSAKSEEAGPATTAAAGTRGAGASSATPSSKSAEAAPTKMRRKTKGMRDSDIIDEEGRSAEEIAAEAALEFDIMGLARRVAEMEEGPDAEMPVRPAALAQQDPVAPAAPEPVAAEPSQAASHTPPPVVSPAPPVAAPATPRLTIEAGHIFMPGPDRAIRAATFAVRDAYWDSIGTSDTELLTYPVCPELKGAPAWPTQRQAFRVVRTPASLILASEGLSDAFAAFRGPSDKNGFGLETFIEVVGWQDADAEELRASWAFKAVEQFARICAYSKGLDALLRGNGIMSLDLPSNCAPDGWVLPEVAEPAGALIDLPTPPGRNQMADMPLSPVRVVPLTLIFPEELEDCIVGGPTERTALANDLLTTGRGHKTDPSRASLR